MAARVSHAECGSLRSIPLVGAASLCVAALVSLAACGSSDSTSPNLDGLEALPATSATVGAAIDYLTAAPVVVAPACAGSVLINCASGSPGTPVTLSITHGAMTVEPASATNFNFSTALLVTSLQSIPLTVAGATCGVTINTAGGANPSINYSGTAVFTSNTGDGVINRVNIGSSVITGMESTDFSVTGGPVCLAAAGLSSVMLSVITSSLEANASGSLCGAPGPAIFKACPQPAAARRRY